MWKQMIDLGKRVYSVTHDTQKNTEDIKAIRTQLEALSETVRRMAYEQQRDRENAAHERENLFLRLEVALLRSNRQPLSSGDTPSVLEEGEDVVFARIGNDKAGDAFTSQITQAQELVNEGSVYHAENLH